MAAHLAFVPSESRSLTVLDGVVADLCRASFTDGRTVVEMPVATQFGGGISVSVWINPDGLFLVSDDGMAHHDLTVAAASERTFLTVARQGCERYGATFDGQTMMFMRVEADRLKGALIAMTSLMKEVIDTTLERSFAAKVNQEREEFVRRVGEAFSPQAVTEHALVQGHSTTTHDVDALVRTEQGLLAFDFFSRSPASISAAYLKLSDIARLEDGPKPVGVTPDKEAIGPKLNLIQSAAHVIEARSPTERYQQLAA